MSLFPGRKSFAQRGEDLAARHLRKLGFRILDRNVRLGRFEIDLIAREGDTVAFVEVKTRRSGDPVDPQENVGYTKQRHIREAAHRYIGEHEEPGTYYRFDVVTVILPTRGKPEITLYRDAFPDQ